MAGEEEQSAARSTGKVNWFSNSKGYGFITPDDGGEELFVHQSSIVSDGFRTLTDGESVEFTVAMGDDGKTKAVDVTAVGGAPLGKKESSFRGKGGRRGGAASGPGCFNCGEVGHMARDCDNNGDNNNNGGGGGGGTCYVCGEAGHFARECRQSGSGSGGGGGACYTCGGYGHMARNCVSGRPSGGDGRGVVCYECKGTGHLARDCDRRRGGGDSKCFNCGKEGHFARSCPVVSA